MIRRLIKAISKRLEDCIPEVENRYPYNPPQNFKEPCFIIECVNQSNSDMLTLDSQKEIILVDYLFSVTLLFPRNDRKYKDVVSRVLLCLKWLYLENGKPILTLNREAHPIDDSSYSFTFTVKREVVQAGSQVPLMEELKEEVGLNNEE